jgi:DNA-binding NtrC family response regulator
MTGAGQKILIIDDEKAICKNFLDFFDYFKKFKAVAYFCAEDALNSLNETECPFLCIVDNRLPGMRGDEFINRARMICPQCRFLICTGSLDIKLSPGFQEIGLVEEDIFFKPVDMFKVLERIEDIIEGK